MAVLSASALPSDFTKSGEAGCPSGLQPEPVDRLDPLGSKMDVTDFIVRKDGLSQIDLIIQGAHCAGCMAKIERGVGEIPGVSSARMNLSTMKLNVTWHEDEVSPVAILDRLHGLGYGAAPYETNALQKQSEDETRRLLRSLAVAGFATMNIMLLSIAVWSGGGEMGAATRSILHWISAMIALPAVAYAGQPFFRSAIKALKQRQTNMDVPISLAVILACSLSLYETVKGNPDTYFDAAVMLLFLLLIGRFLDARLRMKTGEAAQRLAAMQSSSATRILDDGRLETIATRQVRPGDMLLIPVGQRIPVDARIITGRSEIDTHIATGESLPRVSGPGDMIYSGTINLSAPLTVEAIALEADSFLSEITNLVETGEQSKSRYVRIADRAARAYVPVVHSLALLTFLGWIIAGADMRPAILNAIAVLIITCPCALGLAVPAVQVVTVGRLFRSNILVKSGDALERLSRIRSVIFDKTGTLTKGEFALDNKDDISGPDLEIAAALAVHSRHPIAKALHPFKGERKASHVIEQAGKGLTGTVDGKNVSFGAQAGGADADRPMLSTDSWLHIEGQEPIRFTFSDTLREDATSTLAALKTLGVTTEMLSGDSADIAKTLGREIGIARVKGDVTPQQKQNIIFQRLSEGRYPLMVGDGINDAPALAAAYASASVGTASDISRTTADIILQGDRLAGLPRAIKIARKSQRRVIENLSLAVIYNLIAIPLAVFGYVNPLIAALAMSGSSLLVTLNALRMVRS